MRAHNVCLRQSSDLHLHFRCNAGGHVPAPAAQPAAQYPHTTDRGPLQCVNKSTIFRNKLVRSLHHHHHSPFGFDRQASSRVQGAICVRMLQPPFEALLSRLWELEARIAVGPFLMLVACAGAHLFSVMATEPRTLPQRVAGAATTAVRQRA